MKEERTTATVEKSASLQDAEKEVASLAKIAVAGITVHDQQSADNCVQVIRHAKRMIDELEKERKKATGPLRLVEKTVNSWFRPVTDGYRDIEKAGKEALAAWYASEREAQAKAFQAAAEAHQQGDHAAAAEALATSNDAAAARAPRGATIAEVWIATITNPPMVPREWCVPDEPRIKAVARTTPSDQIPPHIPGVTFTKETRTTSVRQ